MEPNLGPRAVRLSTPAPVPEPAPPAPLRRPRRGVSVLPSLFTLANLFCGYACVVYAMRGEFETAAPLIGIAQGAVDEFVARAQRMSGPGRSADSVALQLRLAESAAEVDAARALHRQDIREILDRAARGEGFSELDRIRYRRDKAFIARLCVRAVDRLFEGSGARAVLDAEPIQRCHRDAHGASHHAALSWDLVAEQFGRQAMGIAP